MNKKPVRIFVTALFLILTICFNYANSFTVIEEINKRKSVYNFKEIRLFDFVTTNLKKKNIESIISQGTVLKLNSLSKETLLQSRDENIFLKIPVSESEFMELELIISKVLADDFRTASISGNGEITYLDYKPGLYYRGVLKGDNKSWAALSIFDEYVMCVIASGEGNYNISRLKQGSNLNENTYIFFNDKFVPEKNHFTCLTPDETLGNRQKTIDFNNNYGSDVLQYPIKEYFECDYKMYQDFGSNITRVNNFISSVYNSVIAVYQAEQIGTVLQSVYIWTSPDIYINTNSLPVMIKRFGAKIKNNFNGHLGLLVSTRTNVGGGYAWVDVLCGHYNSGDSSGPYSVCVLDTNYHPYPVYSWIINVLTHEMGHNIGSTHTHNCFWPGGPIDTCYYVEGGCYNGPLKPRVGTIMSYCHINGGVNLAFGFGPLPGNLIRQRFINAPCLIGIQKINSQVPTDFELLQNYPNPFNPETQIIFKVARYSPVKLIIYDLLGKEIAVLVNESLEPGTYKMDYNAISHPSGTYFYQLKAGDFTATRKMILIK